MVLWLTACTPSADPALAAELEAARAEVVAALPPAPEGFAPDLVLHLSPPLVGRLVKTALREIPPVIDRRTVMGIGLRTELRIDDVQVRSPSVSARSSGDSFLAATHLTGQIDVDGGYFGKARVPIGVDALVGVAIAGETTAETFRATAAPISVESFSLTFTELSGTLQSWLSDPRVQEPLRERVESALLAREPVRLATWPRDDLPVRGFRVEPEGLGVRVAMLSTAVRPGRVEPDAPAQQGFRLDAAVDTVLWLARAEAFARDPIDLRDRAAAALPEVLAPYSPQVTILPVPEALSITGDRFVLDVRLWRIVDGGPAWWRQFAAGGALRIDGGHLQVVVDEVTPGPTSARAGQVDPLAAFAQTVVLTNLTEPLTRTLPAARAASARGHAVRASLQRVAGEGGTLRMFGSLDLD